MMKGLLLVAALLLVPSTALAADGEEEMRRASAALDKGDVANALLDLEGLADAGIIHPDASYNRGIAYAMRSRSADALPGDLGRAAAAFEEAARLRPNDAEAEKALDLVRAEIARRRSKQDESDVLVRPSLDRAVLELVSPAVWSLAAMGASLLLAVGLLMRWKKEGWVHVAGAVLAPLAFVALLALAPIAWTARDLAATRRPGVIVVSEATLEGDAGKVADAPDIPEGSLVEVGERKDELVLVRWGNYEGWLPARAVRVLALR